MSLDIYLNNIDVSLLRQPFSSSGDWQIEVSGDPFQLYTLLVYDLDAPYPNQPKNSPFLHYLVINIPGDLSKGYEVISWMPPQPPQDSPAHRYVFALYEQSGEIPPFHLDKRATFPLDAFLLNNMLFLVDRKVFLITSGK